MGWRGVENGLKLNKAQIVEAMKYWAQAQVDHIGTNRVESSNEMLHEAVDTRVASESLKVNEKGDVRMGVCDARDPQQTQIEILHEDVDTCAARESLKVHEKGDVRRGGCEARDPKQAQFDVLGAMQNKVQIQQEYNCVRQTQRQFDALGAKQHEDQIQLEDTGKEGNNTNTTRGRKNQEANTKNNMIREVSSESEKLRNNWRKGAKVGGAASKCSGMNG